MSIFRTGSSKVPTLDFASRYDLKSNIDVIKTKTKNIILYIYILTRNAICSENVSLWAIQKKQDTVFPHIVAAATILFWIHLVRKLFKFSFPLCNENLNSFLTRWGIYSRRGNYSREETIWGNTVFILKEEILTTEMGKTGK